MEHIPETRMRLGKVRSESDRPAVRLRRFQVATLRLQGGAQVVMDRSQFWGELYRVLEGSDRFGGLAAGEKRLPEVVVRRERIRVQANRRFQNRDSFRNLPSFRQHLAEIIERFDRSRLECDDLA